MKLSFSDITNAHALHGAISQVEGFKAQLEAHLKSDFAAVEQRLRECIAHFESEAARLKTILHPRVAAHVADGVSVPDAIVKTQQDQLTASENAQLSAVDGVARAQLNAELVAKAAGVTPEVKPDGDQHQAEPQGPAA